MLLKKVIDFISLHSRLNKNHNENCKGNICIIPKNKIEYISNDLLLNSKETQEKVICSLKKDKVIDLILFIKQYIKHPKEIGSLIPSSESLSKMMTASIIGNGDTLIELGAGTGVFTKHIKLKFSNHKLYVFEKNTNFHENLLKINNIDLYCNALDMTKIIDINQNKVSDVISGLPLRSIDNEISNVILSHAFYLLINGGQFIQFTYGFKSPINNDFLKEHNMVLDKKIYVINNIPPATIYIYKKTL